MDTFELLQRLSVALAIGLIIGLERGWQSRDHPEGGRAAGLRTHALCALLGGVWGAIAQTKGVDGVLALGLAFSAFSAAIIVFRYRETAHEGTFGATTVVAAMLAFTLGSFAVVGDVQAAAAAGVAVAGLLSLKRVLHDWLIRLSWDELRSALVLLAMTCVLLPLLPNHTVDPWSAINPFELWLMTIMIAAISFVGYAAIKFAGIGAGAVIMGVAGGLTSSTAVTMTLSKLAGEHPGGNRALGAGIVLSMGDDDDARIAHRGFRQLCFGFKVGRTSRAGRSSVNGYRAVSDEKETCWRFSFKSRAVKPLRAQHSPDIWRSAHTRRGYDKGRDGLRRERGSLCACRNLRLRRR